MADKPQKIDIVLRGGDLIDGTGSARRKVDVAIVGDRVAGLVEPGQAHYEATTEIDATGKIVAPGFIDVHTHDDNAVLTNPDMTAKISQGVTTVIGGNCGISLAPVQAIDPPPPLNLLGGSASFRFERMADYADAVDAARPAVNIAMQVGHSTLRVGVVADIRRKANASEIDTAEAKIKTHSGTSKIVTE